METTSAPSLKDCCFAYLLRCGWKTDFSDISLSSQQHQLDLVHIISDVMNEDLQLEFFRYCVAQQWMDDKLFQTFEEQCPKIKNQTVLYMHDCRISDAVIERIQKSFHNLKILDLSGCTEVTSEGFNYLPALTSLTSLNLEQTLIGDDSLRALSALTGLQSLNVQQCPQISYAAVVPLLLALNDIAHFDCEPSKLTPHKYRDEERYYKADSDESEEGSEEDEEDMDEDTDEDIEDMHGAVDD